MRSSSCGIDFGTSNSSAAVTLRDKVVLVPLEDGEVTLPSAMFFPPGRTAVFGRNAISAFTNREEGRFMRSLKRVLGSSLMKQGTVINGKPWKFEAVISAFLANLKQKAESFSKLELHNVVMGRPVRFTDNSAEADSRAQDELLSIAKSVGFTNVVFQFEPIAAAFAHEVNLKGENLALVVDLGGGTSDFSVVRLSDKYLLKADRSKDILANTGVRLGGNDFDSDLTLGCIMPEIGYRSTYGPKNLEVPLKFFHDLADWSKVNFLYTPKVLSQVRLLLHQSHDASRFRRLLTLLEHEDGHTLLGHAEDAKIALTKSDRCNTPLDFIERNFYVEIHRNNFEQLIMPSVDQICASALECVNAAGLKPDDVQLLILTGGSTEIPLIKKFFQKLFPLAKLSDQNKLSSVALGLGHDSMRRFK